MWKTGMVAVPHDKMTRVEAYSLAVQKAASAKRYHPDGAEANRLSNIVEMLEADLTEEDKVEYHLLVNPVLTLEQKRKKEAEELRQMEANKDSESI